MTAEQQPRLLVALATYNERDNLKPLIEEIHQQVPQANVLVIDDNSPDGTGKLADEMAGNDSRILVLHREGKLGLGTAILAGIRYALKHDYDLHVTMDADFSHHPRYLPAMLKGMDEHDVMIGSRYVPGGGTLNWPMTRRLISWSVNALTRVLMRISAHDTSGAYRCYRVSKLREVALDQLISRGYSFPEELLYRCRKAGCSIGETPIIFEERRAGASKVDLKEAVYALSLLLWIGLGAFFGWDRWRRSVKSKA